jgi:hypothetical protein
VAGWAPSEGCKLLAGHLLARFVLLCSKHPPAPSPHTDNRVTISNNLWPSGRIARAAGCLLGICSQILCCCSHKIKPALNSAAAPLCSTFDCRVARGVNGLGLAIGSLAVYTTSTHAYSSVQRASQHTSQMQSYASGPAACMTRRGMRSTSMARCQPYPAIGQATDTTEGYLNRNVYRLLAFTGERRLLPCLAWTK